MGVLEAVARQCENAWPTLRGIGQVAESLVWPVQCAGCNAWDLVLCARCESLARGDPLDLVLDDHEGIPSWPMLALGEYESQLRALVLAAKHDRNRDLNGFLLQAGRTLGAAVAGRPELLLPVGDRPETPGRVWVVPVPSSRSRRRAKAEIVPLVAEGVARGLRSFLGDRTRFEVIEAVALRPSGIREWLLPRTQAGLGKRARRAARAGSMVATVPIPRGVQVLVVDDVCASGATLREALRVIGPAAVGIAVLAASL